MAKVTNIYNKQCTETIDFTELRYCDIFDYMNEGVLIINKEGKIVYSNTAYEKIFRVSNIAIVGKSIFRVVNDDAIIKGFKQKKSITGKIDYFIKTKQIYVSVSPIYYNKEFQGVIGLYNEKKAHPQKKDIDFINKEVDKIDEIKKTNTENNQYFQDIITANQIMKEKLRIAEKASKVSTTVLIRGASGTGKELVAKAIHYASNRKNKPFIKVNCGAIPANLLETELFGHEKGSFTGAIKNKIGKVELANGGTLFLDEIGDMPMDMQVKLLRVLQEKEFERVGGSATIKSDIRIISATHRNLEEQIEKERFREDLYYRLNVISIQLPSLRERIEDIPLICDCFIKKINKKIDRQVTSLSNEVLKAFNNYHWPGNIREMENLIEQLIVLSDKNEIELNDLPNYISNIYHVNSMHKNDNGFIQLDEKGNLLTLEEYEKEIIKVALQRFGSFNAAGKALGVTHKTIAAKARKYNIVD
ncbi:MAG: sigma 54-interacting transcriptional regulator [Clostridiaceae bacterium]|nr:sigma 54-interacting transcriptional regulator [Clostridiaceae bacterium]